MAEVTTDKPGRIGRPCKYPWNEWLDGQVWKLVQGTDFDTAPEAFRDTARHYAIRHGLKFGSCIKGNRVIIQAIRR
jgi:hypothetical protein